MKRFLGMDIGGTKCAVVIGDEAGKIHQRVAWPSQAERGPAAMVRDLVEHAREIAADIPVHAAGAAIGGPIDSERGIIYSPPNLPGWDGVPLKEQLQEALQMPVAVEHDGAACALAEYQWGAHGERMAYLTCGTGLGVGLVFDGKIYRGSAGNAPDFGHIRYRDDGPLAYGKRGCFESYGAGSAIARLASWRFPQRWPEGTIDSPSIAKLSAAGDPDASTIIQMNADAVGEACALLADLLYTDLIVLGSLASYLGADWLTQVRGRFAQSAYPRAAAHCRIIPATLGDRLQDCSSYVAAMSFA